MKLKLISAALLACFACLLPLSVSKAHEINATVPPVPKMVSKVAEVQFATESPLEGIYTAPAVLPSDHVAVMAAAGIGAADYKYADYIVGNESGWCSTKWQGTHACPDSFQDTGSLYDTWEGYGLCQSTPGIKMSAEGGNWKSDPITQMKWCANYASKYGGWKGAYEFWYTHHWW